MSDWSSLISELEGKTYSYGLGGSGRITFEPGLTATELARIEDRHSFQFPPDLRGFLMTGLPTGPGFPDWRTAEAPEVEALLEAPKEGVLFDVEHNAFWLPEWGPRPPTNEAALQAAGALLDAAPRLVPIYSHRMMPVEPSESGNPVLSVHQADIIYYGYDLEDYFRHEFDLAGRAPWPESVRQIRFWDIDRFQEVAWQDESREFDNRDGELPR